MVEAGMPVDIDDGHDWTALSRAAWNNQTEVVRCLLGKRANVNKQDRFGRTALHVASIKSNTDVMRILLQHGARKDITDNIGITPIDHARWRNYKEAVDLLEQYQVSTSDKFTNHLLMFHVAFVRLKCNFRLSKCI